MPHVPPSWIESGCLFFITICADRKKTVVFDKIQYEQIIQSAMFYHKAGKWWVRLFLVMPDHIHAIMAFDRSLCMQDVVTDWKRYISRQAGVIWQRDFVDHRLRRDESLEEKSFYIRQNPVRAGLVADADDWLYVIDDSSIQNAEGRACSPSAPPA